MQVENQREASISSGPTGDRYCSSGEGSWDCGCLWASAMVVLLIVLSMLSYQWAVRGSCRALSVVVL